MKIFIGGILAGLLSLSAPALAANFSDTPPLSSSSNGAVQMCVDANNHAIPISSNCKYVPGSTLPTNAAQETGGNLATIAGNSATQSTAANQTSVQATAGSQASKAEAVQGITSGVPITTAQIRTSFFADTSTTLGSTATYLGASHDSFTIVSSSQSVYTYFGATFYADQAGTADVDESTDNATWYEVASQAVSAGTGVLVGPSVDLNVHVRARYYRVRYINGATAQGTFRVISSFTAS